jgi:hypothetical protein
VSASGAEGVWLYTAAALRASGFAFAFLRLGTALDTAAFFAVTPGSEATGVFARVLVFTAFEARAVVAARPFLAGDFFTGG